MPGFNELIALLLLHASFASGNSKIEIRLNGKNAVTEQTVLFSERQKFTQPWLWALLAGVTGLVWYGALTEMIFHPIHPEVAGGIVAMLSPGLLFALFLACRLDTEITAEGVHYRFYPFHLKWQTIKWEKVQSAWVRRYHPLSGYGGWGIRYTFSGAVAYNVRGSIGLQLILKNKSKILIGTQRGEALQNALHRLGIKGE